MALPSVFDSLNSLQGLTQIDVTLTGEWTNPDVTSRTWVGTASAEIPLVGILFSHVFDRVYWSKASIFPTQLALELTLQQSPNMQWMNFSIRLEWAQLGFTTKATQEALDQLSSMPAQQVVKTGQLFHILTSPDGVQLYGLFYAKTDAKIARKHIWGLKKRFHPHLSAPLLTVLSRGRKGVFML
jgi:hypothetical protein